MFKNTKLQPLVSVIIPCYNHEKYVVEAIKSIINQDYENIELIVIDDGSNDSSVEKIKETVTLCEKRFKRFEFRSRPNKGLCATLNEAIEWCEGEFFTPMASDDIALPHKTRFLIDKIKNSDYAAVFGSMQAFSDLNENLNISKLECLHSFDDLMLQINIPCAPAAILRKSAVVNIGGYAEDVKLEDRYMWLTLTNNGEKIISFPEVVVLYRQHDSNTINNIRKMQEYRLEVLNKFNSSVLYDKAIKNSYLVCARGLANKEIVAPIAIVLKTKNYNKKGAFIIARALAPNFIVNILKSF